MIERRRYPRFTAHLPFLLKVRPIEGKVEPRTMILFAEDVSHSGLCFTAKSRLEPGFSIEAEVVLLGHGPGGSDVHISGEGHIVRAEDPNELGWYRMAATFAEPPPGAAPGWNQLTASFDDPPSSSKKS
jgi:hypothetical protein